jgi:Flp pilus assembly protein TadG
VNPAVDPAPPGRRETLKRFRVSARAPRRRGVVAPMVAVLLTVMIGVTALAIDGGILLIDRREAWAAADAAALAAAIDLFQNYDKNQGADPNGTAATSAKDTAKDNGFADGVNGVTVTVNIPPKSGTFVDQAGYAEVIITEQQGRFFSGIWGTGKIPVSGRAVARGIKSPKSNGIIVLDPSSSNALTATNTANITVQQGNIIVDSNDSKGGTISNSGNISAVELDFSGDPRYNTTGSGKFIASSGNILSSQTPTPDPLASLAPPSESGSEYYNVNISGLPSGNNSWGYPTPGNANGYTLLPGVYNNGIQVSDNNSSHTYTLASGIYYFKGGGLSLTANANITSDSNGVLLYFNSGNALQITAGGSVNLTPLQSGTYAGITIYEDRNNTSQDRITGQSTGSLNISGTVYTPAAKFTLTGSGGNYAVGSQYIVYQLVVTGSGTFNVLYNAPALTPGRQLYLVE